MTDMSSLEIEVILALNVSLKMKNQSNNLDEGRESESSEVDSNAEVGELVDRFSGELVGDRPDRRG